MKPCDCKSAEEAMRCLDEQGISFNNDSLRIRPGVVLLTIGPVHIKIPMSRFKQFAEWYLEDQEINEKIDSKFKKRCELAAKQIKNMKKSKKSRFFRKEAGFISK